MCLNFFFSHENLFELIFSSGRPFKIYFFLKKYPGIFSLDFLRLHPQIINGRPLTFLLTKTKSMLKSFFS